MMVKYTKIGETVARLNARVAELEAALAHQTRCREDSDRKAMESDDALNATAHQLAEEKATISRYQKADDAAVQLLEKAKLTLTVPAAEYVPAISEAWELIELALGKIR